ncbi:MAG: 2TM domain-containing protein [Kovacikia sp.]
MTDSYRSDDVQQILQSAMTRKQEGEFSREQLLEMASELGISEDNLQIAEQEWLAQREEIQERKEFDAALREGVKSHFFSYLAVNTFLLLLNLVTEQTISWALYPLLGWGLGLLIQALQTYQLKGEKYEVAFQHWREHRRIRDEKREQQHLITRT